MKYYMTEERLHGLVCQLEKLSYEKVITPGAVEIACYDGDMVILHAMLMERTRLYEVHVQNSRLIRWKKSWKGLTIR
jgi:hypothetical protein